MTNTPLEDSLSCNTPSQSRRQTFTFVGDSDLTFVNYSDVNSLTYRQEARFHNAQRRAQKNKRHAAIQAVPSANISDPKISESRATKSSPSSSYLPARNDYINLSLADLELNNKTILSSRFQLLENVWRNVFYTHFFLPSTDTTCPLIPDPQITYLSIGRANWRNYRNIIMQPVVTSEAKKGRQAMDVVWRNQAMMLQDFRFLTKQFTGPGLILTQGQFQQVFSAALAFIFHCIAFKQEDCYNAIIEVNFALMATRENKCLRQMPSVEWIRMLLPRPPPSFDRSWNYQLEMLSKVELVLDFLAEVQKTVLCSSLQRSISCDALLHIVTTDISLEKFGERYPGFYSICLHRILFLLHVHLTERTEQDNHFLLLLNNAAKSCLTYPVPARVTLFLWTILNQSSMCGECRDSREPYFHWAMRDLITVHKLSFLDRLISWLLHRLGQGQTPVDATTMLDIPALRLKMRMYYCPESFTS